MTSAVTSIKRAGRPQNQALINQRREEILAMATLVFAEHGFRNTDVQIIADALGIGKGTIYRYFPSKKDLFLGAADRGMRLFLERLETEADKSTEPLQRMENVIHAYLAFFDENPGLVELIIQERAEFRDREKSTYFLYCESRRDKWHEAFRNIHRLGLARELSPESMFENISNLLYGTMFTNFFAGREKPCDEQARDIIDIFFNGILKDRRETRPRG